MTKPRLIISNYDDLKNPYYAGGGAVAVHEVAMRLTNQFEVTVVTSKFPGSSDCIVDGVLYRRFGISWGGPKFSQIIYQLFLPMVLLSQKFDLWLETFGPPFTSALLPLFTRKPVVGLVHMLPGFDMQRKYHIPVLPRLVEKFAIKLYSRFIVLSEDTSKEIRDINPKAQIQIIPNGVILPSRMPLLSPQHILFMGRLETNQKGLDLLLYAYKLLLPVKPPPLVIAGSGSQFDQKRITDIITKLELTDQVVLTGKVGGAVKDRLYRQAVCVVVPSRFESFSMVALEALAYSRPLVCFDILGLKWIPTFCAQKAGTLTPKSLADAISHLLTHLSDRQKLSRMGRSFAHRFNWSNIADLYAKYLLALHSDFQVYWSSSLNPSL